MSSHEEKQENIPPAPMVSADEFLGHFKDCGLEGRVLTLAEAAFSEEIQLRAVKSLLRGAVDDVKRLAHAALLEGVSLDLEQELGQFQESVMNVFALALADSHNLQLDRLSRYVKEMVNSARWTLDTGQD